MRRLLIGSIVVVLVVAACGGGSKKAATTTTTTTTTSSSSSSASSSSGTPSGFDAISDPTGGDPALFGQNVALTMTKDERPVVAFSIKSAAAGDLTSKIVTATLNATTKKFDPLVTVATATLNSDFHSVSIAHDATTDALVLAWDDNGKILAAQSTDSGSTWKQTTVTATASSARNPSIAVANSKVVVAFNDEDNKVSIATGDLTGTTFTVAGVPQPTDGGEVSPAAPTAAAAADGSFGVSYVVAPAAGGVAVEYLKVGSATPVHVLDSNGVQNDDPIATMSFAGSNPVVGAIVCNVENEDDACTFAAVSADGGATFSAPVAVPADKGTGPGLNLTIAADGQGELAISYNPNSSNGTQVCGVPELADSGDGGKTWQICGPESPDPNRSLSFGAGPPALAVSPAKHLVIAFQQTDPTNAPTGVLVKVIA